MKGRSSKSGTVEVIPEASESLERKLRKELWQGSVPVRIVLDPMEVTTLTTPAPFFIMAPRNGYLPLLVDQIRPHFQHTLPPLPIEASSTSSQQATSADTPWFDYNGLPLKWHVPTGVLYDMLAGADSGVVERPWRLTVHFRSYPSNILLACEDITTVRFSFLNSLKEASYITWGNTRNVMGLSQADQNDLWHAVATSNGEAYERATGRLHHTGTVSPNPPVSSSPPAATSILRRLSSMSTSDPPAPPSPSSPSKGPSSHARLGKVPLRIHLRRIRAPSGNDDSRISTVASWDDVTSSTRPIDLPKEHAERVTLWSALHNILPELFPAPMVEAPPPPSEIADQSGHPKASHVQIEDGAHGDPSRTAGASTTGEKSPFSEEGQSEATTTTAAALPPNSPHAVDEANLTVGGGEGRREGEKRESEEEAKERVVVRVQGIEPELDVPLDWLAQNFAGPDLFLHVCVNVLG